MDKDKDKAIKNKAFHKNYSLLCMQANVRISAEVAANASSQKLIFLADKLKLPQWAPLLQALSHDTSLKELCIRSLNRTRTELVARDTYSSVLEEKHVPPIHTVYLMRLVAKMIARHANNNPKLLSLTLKGLILNDAFLKPIMSSVIKAENLMCLCLCHCPINDSGAFIICNALHEVTPLEKLDLSYCGLTVQGAKHVVQMLKSQEFSRGTTAWENSLRYCANKVKKNCGLKKIILNGNKAFEDKGSRLILEYLKDDHFIRIIGLRDCGWTSETLIRTCKLHNVNKTIFVDLGIDLDQIPMREIPSGEGYDEKLRSIYVQEKGKEEVQEETEEERKKSIIEWMKSYPTPEFSEVFGHPPGGERIENRREKVEEREIVEIEEELDQEEEVEAEEEELEEDAEDLERSESSSRESEESEVDIFDVKIDQKPSTSERLDIKKNQKVTVSDSQIRSKFTKVQMQQPRRNVPRKNVINRPKIPPLTKQTKSLGDIKTRPSKSILAELAIGDTEKIKKSTKKEKKIR